MTFALEMHRIYKLLDSASDLPNPAESGLYLSSLPNGLGLAPSRFNAPRIRRVRVQILGQAGQPSLPPLRGR